ncbi:MULTISPECIES: hypothetical protein [Aphanizomenon]|uniref:Uncharacterized protein n=1 Tax=Aphanizomenon flos-aquae FACHB-1040 TaxID=2692887 RepID=A0ABR8C3A0_APHFL|nr:MULTISPECIES: hypothetical protein [Aphanizomenon]MBD2281603.1 hypothetical protein [Aphanizomenon flos-aquae FACHB-1040]MBO1068291.1 hypothetical protein [Dolichospermum sp. DEX189]MTJ32752.1 hypothetical protein [Aphanizomenon sp. UHCC 0183]
MSTVKQVLTARNVPFTESKDYDDQPIIVVNDYTEEDVLDSSATDILATGYDEQGNLVINIQE